MHHVSSVITAVRTPLGLCTLIILVIEAILGVVLAQLDDVESPMGYTIIGVMAVAFLIITAVVAYRLYLEGGGGSSESEDSKPRGQNADTASYQIARRELEEMQQGFNAIKDELSLLHGEYQTSCHAVFRIINQLYPEGLTPLHHISKVDFDWFPKGNGDGPVSLTVHIKAINHPVQFWKYWISADAESQEVSFLKQIEFDVKDQEDTEVAYLISRNEGRHKELCIFFLPQIEPGLTRKLELSYRWPGIARHLLDKNEDRFEWEFQSVRTDELSEVTFRAHFEREIGDVKCTNVGVRVNGASPKSEPSKENGITWVYHVPAVSLRNKTFSLLFERDKKR